MTHTVRNLAIVSISFVSLAWVDHRASHAAAFPKDSVAQTVAAETVPVIVELFTSEGCSSCPPADTLLASLEARQPFPKTQIIALEEHVDYWNSGGWMDPFSSREWTMRQQDYAGSLKNQNPYTPQMIVDGQTEFVGNREDSAAQAIEKAAAQPKAHVSLSLAPSGKAGVEQAVVSVDQLTENKRGDKTEVLLAVTESGLHSAVSAGENAGSDLHHASIVRSFRKIGSIDLKKQTSFAGTTPVHLDSSWKRQNLHIVVFVQDQKSRQILGSAAARIEP
jgi:hypothetical protein